jgi:hypothetical protein
MSRPMIDDWSLDLSKAAMPFQPFSLAVFGQNKFTLSPDYYILLRN